MPNRILFYFSFTFEILSHYFLFSLFMKFFCFFLPHPLEYRDKKKVYYDFFLEKTKELFFFND